jgi:aspartate/methionine/tyrosine aminotransferase
MPSPLRRARACTRAASSICPSGLPSTRRRSRRDGAACATDAHAYPQTVGTAALREAITAWYDRRRGVPGLSVDEVLPTVGSKELVALLPLLLDLGAGDIVVHPRAAYPTYEVGAKLVRRPRRRRSRSGPWARAWVWLNTPGNPDGRVLGVDELRAAVTRARELGAVIVSDECYAELGWDGPWADAPIPSILDPRVVGGDRRDMLSVYSLSKQSNLAGYRAAFLAGDATSCRGC